MLCDTVCISTLASIQSRIEAASDAHLLHPSYPRLPYRDVSLCSALHTQYITISEIFKNDLKFV